MQVAKCLGTRLKNRRKRHMQQPYSLARRNRVLLLAFACFAVCSLFWFHPQPTAREVTTPPPLIGTSPTVGSVNESGRGAGGTGEHATNPLTPVLPSLCNPFDTNCFASGVASWIATNIQNALQPIADLILKNPSNIISQTPILQGDSQDTPLLAMNNLFIGVVDTALAFLLLIGAYNVMIGHHLAMQHTSLTEFLPRALLVVCAVHFNQFFLANFINLENELALAVVHTVGLAMLTNILAGIFTNPFTGLLTFILEVVLGIMTILLLLQMIVRLALVAVCVATAPLGLGCLMLPQSLRWGRLWLTLFASSVMVQFIQIAALGLGGVFITAIASTSFVRLDVQLATAFLAIGTLLLVLKIPGILQNWALHPMMNGFNGGGSGQSGQDATSGGGDAMGGMGGGSMGGGMGGAQMMEGTVVTEESGALLLLF